MKDVSKIKNNFGNGINIIGGNNGQGINISANNANEIFIYEPNKNNSIKATDFLKENKMKSYDFQMYNKNDFYLHDKYKKIKLDILKLSRFYYDFDSNKVFYNKSYKPHDGFFLSGDIYTNHLIISMNILDEYNTKETKLRWFFSLSKGFNSFFSVVFYLQEGGETLKSVLFDGKNFLKQKKEII